MTMRAREELIAENKSLRRALAGAGRMLMLGAAGVAKPEDLWLAAREVERALGERPTEASAGRA